MNRILSGMKFHNVNFIAKSFFVISMITLSLRLRIEEKRQSTSKASKKTNLRLCLKPTSNSY